MDDNNVDVQFIQQTINTHLQKKYVFPILSPKLNNEAVKMNILSQKNKELIIKNPNLHSELFINFRKLSPNTNKALDNLGISVADCEFVKYRDFYDFQIHPTENLIQYLQYITKKSNLLKQVIVERNKIKKQNIEQEIQNKLYSQSYESSIIISTNKNNHSKISSVHHIQNHKSSDQLSTNRTPIQSLNNSGEFELQKVKSKLQKQQQIYLHHYKLLEQQNKCLEEKKETLKQQQFNSTDRKNQYQLSLLEKIKAYNKKENIVKEKIKAQTTRYQEDSIFKQIQYAENNKEDFNQRKNQILSLRQSKISLFYKNKQKKVENNLMNLQTNLNNKIQELFNQTCQQNDKIDFFNEQKKQQQKLQQQLKQTDFFDKIELLKEKDNQKQCQLIDKFINHQNKIQKSVEQLSQIKQDQIKSNKQSTLKKLKKVEINKEIIKEKDQQTHVQLEEKLKDLSLSHIDQSLKPLKTNSYSMSSIMKTQQIKD